MSNKKVTNIKAASAASKTLKSSSTVGKSKAAASRALSQRKAPHKHLRKLQNRSATAAR